MEIAVIYLALCIAIAIWAGKAGRIWFAWLLLAFFFSPLICAIFLAIVGKSGQKCPKCAEIVKRDAIVCRYCGNEFQRQSEL